MANINKTVKLGVFTLAIMNVTAVVSLRELLAQNFTIQKYKKNETIYCVQEKVSLYWQCIA